MNIAQNISKMRQKLLFKQVIRLYEIFCPHNYTSFGAN
jgi:hypothetical protein